MKKNEIAAICIIFALIALLFTTILQDEQYIKQAVKDYLVSALKNPAFKDGANKRAEQALPKDSYWVSYMKNLENTIKANWEPPKSDKTKRVVAFFKISKNGELLSLKIMQSSNDKEADAAALKAIEATAPFKPLPEQFKGENVDIEFTFDYNILGKK